MVVFLVAMIYFFQSEASWSTISLPSPSVTSYAGHQDREHHIWNDLIRERNPWLTQYWPGNIPSFNAYWFRICAGDRVANLLIHLHSKGELLVPQRLGLMPIGNRKLGIRAMYVAQNWFYRCESTNHREVWSSESSGKSWYERGALTCHLVALMGSGQQRCNYEVSRANPFENDPREARGEVL